MLIVIFVIVFILGILLFCVDDSIGAGILSISLAILIIICILIGGIVNGRVIDDKIAMYQEENTKIESQITECVSQYQQHEKEIFTEVSPESVMTLVALYPELKSDALVTKQIEVYLENNQKIKELKENKINISNKKWWVYFGG